MARVWFAVAVLLALVAAAPLIVMWLEPAYRAATAGSVGGVSSPALGGES